MQVEDVIGEGGGSYDAVMIIEVSLGREHVEGQTLCPSVLLDGAVALKGKPTSQGKADHGPLDRRVVPEGQIFFYFFFKAGGHDEGTSEGFFPFPKPAGATSGPAELAEVRSSESFPICNRLAF